MESCGVPKKGLWKVPEPLTVTLSRILLRAILKAVCESGLQWFGSDAVLGSIWDSGALLWRCLPGVEKIGGLKRFDRWFCVYPPLCFQYSGFSVIFRSVLTVKQQISGPWAESSWWWERVEAGVWLGEECLPLLQVLLIGRTLDKMANSCKGWPLRFLLWL